MDVEFAFATAVADKSSSVNIAFQSGKFRRNTWSMKQLSLFALETVSKREQHKQQHPSEDILIERLV